MIRAGIRRAFRLALRRPDRWEREVEDEIKLHLELRAEQLMADGRGVDAAYAEAVRRFGPLRESRARLLEAARHREQRIQRAEYVSDLRQDVGFALRTLARQKGWTAVTVLTLALGIGATTAVFSVVSTFLLHPLPYPDAGRVVYVSQQPSQGNTTGISVIIAPGNREIRAWQQSARSFEALTGYRAGPAMLKTTSEPSRVRTVSIMPNFRAFAGQRPLIGRAFTQADIESGGHVVMLSEGFWRERLGASPDVLGQLLTLDDTSYMVVGVMPAAFRLPDPGSATDIWRPLDVRDDKGGASVLGRLRPGASIVAATRELDSIFARSGGFTSGKIPFKAVISTPFQENRFHDSLVLLTAAVALVLLVACANVAHLLLARSATRDRELAIRSALGAGHGRLLRQLLTESLLLTFTGAVCGVFVGWAGLRAIIALRPPSHDELRAAQLDLTTLGMTVAIAVVSGLVFGVIATFQSSRHSTNDALKSGSLATSRGRAHRRARSLLVVSEMALSATLLVGATLLIRSVAKLQHAELGFEPRQLYTLYFPPLDQHHDAAATRTAFMAEYMARLRQIPGIQDAAITSVGPGSRWFSIGRLEIEGEPPPPKSSTSFIDINAIGPDYFRVMGIHLVQGSTFTDTSVAAHQVIVNAGFARKHWGSASALGQHLRIAQTENEPWMTVVGVAADVAISGPMAESSSPMFYTATMFNGYPPAIALRTDGKASTLANATALARSMGLRRGVNVDGAERFLVMAMSAPRFVMALLTIFTGLALVLACVGLYGVMSYTVAQQTREIGIRIALGASRARVARAVMVRGAALAAVGLGVGLAGARWGAKLLEQQLYGVSPSDATSFVAGGVVLVLAAVAACVLPTRRALAVDPVTAIRAE